MATYNEVFEIEKAIDTALEKSMTGGEIDDVAKLVLRMAIEENVYSYPPGMYIRRDRNGGLSDMRLMVADYDKQSRELTVTTEAMGTYSQQGKHLDTLVETGTEFDWGGNAIFKRTFYPRANRLAEVEPARGMMEDIVQFHLDKI